MADTEQVDGVRWFVGEIEIEIPVVTELGWSAVEPSGDAPQPMPWPAEQIIANFEANAEPYRRFTALLQADFEKWQRGRDACAEAARQALAHHPEPPALAGGPWRHPAARSRPTPLDRLLADLQRYDYPPITEGAS